MPVVAVTELAPGGDAVAHLDHGGERRAVFVRGGCPGDELDVDVDWSTRPARARVHAVRVASADRVAPPCPHAAACGGCDWMHVARAAQLAAHVSHLRAALPQAAREVVEVRAYAAPKDLGCRGRARLHARGSGGRVIVGPNEARTRDPIDVASCAALDPSLDAARATVAALLEGFHGTAEISLALGALEPAPRRAVADVVIAEGSREPPASVFARGEAAVRGGALQGLRVVPFGAKRPAVIGDPTPWTRGADGAPLRLAPGGFAQAHPEVNVMLAARVAESVGEGTDKLVELYAGAGNLTVMLAPRARSVIAVESDVASCEAARANLAARGLRARVTEADASRWAIPNGTQVVVLDPPRAGARAACEQLAASSVKRAVYVSCDPQTLGRDLGILCAHAWLVREAHAFEMFPHTSHVECVVVLDRARRGK